MKKKSEKKEYSENTKRQATQYPGVYQRRSEKTHGVMDTCYDISYKKDGKKVWEKVGWASDGYTSKLAAQVRADRIRRIQHGEELPQEKPKAPYFKEAAKAYFEWLRANKPRNIKADMSRYANSLTIFETKRLDEVNPLDLERVKSSMAKKGYAPQTIKHVLSLFRRILNKALTWGTWTGENPIKKVGMPRVDNARKRFLSHEEAALLLDELKKTSEQLHDIAVLSLYCGLRAGEIFNLKGYDLDFDNRVINIRYPKNSRSRKAYMTNTVNDILLKRVPKDKNEYVFKDHRKGGQIKEVSNSFDRVVEKMGLNTGVTDRLEKLVFHSLRHTFASWLAIEGNNLFVIMELMGQSSLSMVQRYAHLMPNEKRRATMELEQSFDKARERDNVVQLNKQ